MKLCAFYEFGRLILQRAEYIEEGWQIRYDEAKPIDCRWEVIDVPLCGESYIYKTFATLTEAIDGTKELT